MNITPENILDVQHQEWLKHPVTCQLISNLEKHLQYIYNKISIATFDKETSDAEIRLQAAVAKTNITLRFMITNTNEFVGQSKK